MLIHGQTSTTDLRREISRSDRGGVTSIPATPTDGVVKVSQDFTITEEDSLSTFLANTDVGDIDVSVDHDNFPLPEHFKIQVVNNGGGTVTFSGINGATIFNVASTQQQVSSANGHVTVRHLVDGEVLIFGDLDT